MAESKDGHMALSSCAHAWGLIDISMVVSLEGAQPGSF